MGPARKLVACLVVLALCALAPHTAEAAKKKRTAIGRPGSRFLAPAPAPVSAMLRGRTLLAANEDEGDEAPIEEPVETPVKGATGVAAQVAQEQAAPPAGAEAQFAQPQEVAEAPAPSGEDQEEEEGPGGKAKAWGQCGGTAASSTANASWAGPTACVGGSTCVFLSATFSQCIPVAQSRGYGCSAMYAQCGGADPGVTTAWSGPYCCPEASECVFFSNTFSQCKPCNGVWEQCGGTIPGTDVPWTGHGRASCCAAGSSCRYYSTNYYRCEPNASG